VAPEALGPFVALEHRFSLVADEPLTSWLHAAFAPMAEVGPGPVVRHEVLRSPDGSWSVRVDDEYVCRHVDPQAVLHRFMIDLNSRIAQSASAHLLIHAGVVVMSGRAVVLAAPSGSGKSTLVATAARRGFAYGGDEHAAIRFEDGLLVPVPKPLGLKVGSALHFSDLGSKDRDLAPFLRDQLFVSPSDLPGGVCAKSIPIALVVLPHHQMGSGVIVQPIRPASAVMSLRANSFNFTRQPELSLRALARLARVVPTVEVQYGDAASAWGALVTTLREVTGNIS